MKSPISDTADYTKFIAIFLGFISFVLLVAILMALKEILVPVTIAVFLTLLFHPVVEAMRVYGIPRWFSIIIILIIIMIMYYFLILLLLPEISMLPEEASAFTAKFVPYLQELLRPLDITVNDLSKWINIDLAKFRRQDSFLENIMEIGITDQKIFSVPTLLADLFITMLFWSFMIAGKKKFELRLQKAFSENKAEVNKTINTIDEQMQYYILLESIIGLSFGTFIALTLKIAGIELAILFGFLAFILNFIPKIGVVIASVLPVLFAAVAHGFQFDLIIVIIVFFIAVFIIGKYVEPHFLGKYINISPVFVLFSLIFWGWVWGIIGLYLAFPIAAVIKIILSNVDALRPIAIILGSQVNLNKDILLNDNELQQNPK